MFPHLPALHDLQTSEPGKASCALSVPQDHPSIQGHFPGLPIIPGAALLGWVWAAANALELSIRPEVRSSKYLHPIVPGDRIKFVFATQGGGIRAQIFKGESLAAQFLLLCGEGTPKA